jgi:simple sugar transport system permease protein
MLNYIAIELTNYLISDPWRDPSVTEPFTSLFAKGTWLPVIFPGTRLHAGFIVAILATLFLWWLFKKTVYGYQLSVLGANPKAAEYGGLKASRLIVITMLISGGLAGLSGVSEVSGIHHRVIEGISPGYGYTAIAIALLGKKHPIGVLLAAFLFAALETGADGMQQVNGVPVSVALILEALVLLFILVGDYLADKYEVMRMKEG